MKNISTSKILVVGATGFLGMEICRQLIAAHKNVTALVRKSSAPEKLSELKQLGVKLAAGDLKDRDSLKKAIKGIDIVISTASSTMSRQEGDSIQTVDGEGQSNIVDEAIAAGVNQFIYVSFCVMSIDFPLQDAKRRVEKKIVNSKMTYTILQPTFFMEAWLSPAIGFDFPNAKATIYGEGKNKISWISLTDVAAFAVASINNASGMNKLIPLGGSEALSPLEVVALFEKIGGRKFELQHVPVEALQSQRAGAPDELGKSFSSMMLIYAQGDVIEMKNTLQKFPLKLKTVKEYAHQVSQVVQTT